VYNKKSLPLQNTSNEESSSQIALKETIKARAVIRIKDILAKCIFFIDSA